MNSSKSIKILYIASEIHPLIPVSKISKILLALGKHMQERHIEVRVLVPKFGLINEKKYKLHEVVRLSGGNIPINDENRFLSIKVTSIPSAKLQAYLVDNEEYFDKKDFLHTKKGDFYPENDERVIFFCKGVLEMIKAIGWSPDIIHCHDWITSLIPFYLHTIEKNNPLFQSTKIVTTLYPNTWDSAFHPAFIDKIRMTDPTHFDEDKVHALKKQNNIQGLVKTALPLSDIVVQADAQINEQIGDWDNTNTTHFSHELEDLDDMLDKYHALYESLM